MRVTAGGTLAFPIVEAAVKFANLPAITSPEQVQRIFASLPYPWAASHDWVGDVPADAFRKNDRRRMRGWLRAFARQDRRALRRVAREVNAVLMRTIEFRPKLDLRSGELTVEYLPGGGVEEVCAVAAVALFDEGLARRVRRCRWPGCHKFRVTPTGKPISYCGPEHKQMAVRLDTKRRVQWKRERDRQRRLGKLPQGRLLSRRSVG